MRYLSFILLIFFSANNIFSQDAGAYVYQTQAFYPKIKTLRAFVKGNQGSYPAIELNGDMQIHIEFDDLSDEQKSYSYQLIHCNSDKTASDILTSEYMSGFNQNPVNNYNYSFNTTVPYVHYSIDLPNNDVDILLSGNYALRITDDNNADSTAAIVTFSVFELPVNIQAEVKQPPSVDFAKQHQEVRLKILHNDMQINDPFNEIKLLISQNNRPKRELSNLKPVFVRNNELVYNFSGENVLPAGNEFRIIDFASFSNGGLNLNDIRFYDSVYRVQVRLDERRSSKRYVFDEDMNGKYLISLDNSTDSQLSADYAWVYFYLPIKEPFLDGSVYVNGNFNNWQCNETNKMEYNFETNNYEATILLKQGYYNYCYSFVDNYTYTVDESILEGSHFETENDYLISVFYRNFGEKFDRLIGYKVINSNY